MKKQKLALTRETLRDMQSASLAGIRGGAQASLQPGACRPPPTPRCGGTISLARCGVESDDCIPASVICNTG